MRSASFLFLWLLVLIMPWEDIFVIPELASFARILGMLSFLLGLAGTLFAGRLRLPLALVWAALFSAWCAISAEWAPDAEISLRRATTYLLLMTFVWLIYELVDNPKRLKALMRACMFGTTMMIFNMFLNYVHAGIPLNTEEEVRYSAEGANPNGVAFFCSLSILFAFYLITRRERTGFELPNWFYWGFMVAAGLANLLTGSRAGAMSLGVAGLVLSGFLFFGRLRKINRKVRIGLVVSAVLVAMLAVRYVGRSTISRLAEGTSSNTFTVRTNAWEQGLKAWADTPLLGVGAGGYAETLAKRGERRMVAHNTVVSVLVEYGLIGFTLYFLYWGLVIRQAWRLPKADRFFWFGVIALYLPLILSASSEYWKPLWFLSGLLLCATRNDKPVAAGRDRILMLRPEGAGPSLCPPRPRSS